MNLLREPTVCIPGKATSQRRKWQGAEAPPGSKSRARTYGSPRNLGRPCRLQTDSRSGVTGDHPQALGRRSVHARERNKRCTLVPPSEGNEATWEGRQGVGVAHKTSEEGEPSPRDPSEERGGQMNGHLEGKMARQQSSSTVSTKLQMVAELSREHPQRVWTNLAHHIDLDFLRAAFTRVRKDCAPGIDGQTAADYATNLDANLTALLARFKAGTYRAPAVRRVYIPKDDGRLRPIGIPTFEDKILQLSVAMVLGAIYEQDFLPCSYGFRPRRSAHQALEELFQGLQGMWGGTVIKLDIASFFDEMSHAHLRCFLDRRVQDGVIRKAIDKWLTAGALESGQVLRAARGSPQGGVISPLLANIFLHEVLDTWFEREVRPRMRGRCVLVRFADDAVLAFASEQDARRVFTILPKRFARFGLQLHGDKTRLVPFSSPRRGCGLTVMDSNHDAGSFDFLGFTHYWGLSRKGSDVVKRRTAKTRFRRALRDINRWCRANRHEKLAIQHSVLSAKVRGHYGYFGIQGNWQRLNSFRHAVRRIWCKWLGRRSRKAYMSWERFAHLDRRYSLPWPTVTF